MKYFFSAFKAMGVTLKNMLAPVETFEYPKVIRPRPERYRTTFALVDDEHGEEACIGCFLCEKICPSDIIKVDAAPKAESPVTGKKRGYCADFTLDLGACIYCELCVQVCPTDAIVMCRDPQTPGFSREDLVLTMDKLYANGRERVPTWGTGGGLRAMQEPPKPAKKVRPAPAAAAAEPAAAATPSVEAAATPSVEAVATPSVEAVATPSVEAVATPSVEAVATETPAAEPEPGKTDLLPAPDPAPAGEPQ
jgi:NADH-quinone oxidoreductase subunit I